MGRIRVLLVVGLAAIVSALLYVSNGSNSDMVWTYQDCVAWHYYPRSCHANEMCAQNISGPVCLRTEPKLQSWVFVWVTESVLVFCACCVMVPVIRLSAAVGRH